MDIKQLLIDRGYIFDKKGFWESDNISIILDFDSNESGETSYWCNFNQFNRRSVRRFIESEKDLNDLEDAIKLILNKQ